MSQSFEKLIARWGVPAGMTISSTTNELLEGTTQNTRLTHPTYRHPARAGVVLKLIKKAHALGRTQGFLRP